MADAMTLYMNLRFDFDQTFIQPSGTGRGSTAKQTV
jgi:hypothetical protein